MYDDENYDNGDTDDENGGNDTSALQLSDSALMGMMMH